VFSTVYLDGRRNFVIINGVQERKNRS
jgi:hypothetical protein